MVSRAKLSILPRTKTPTADDVNVVYYIFNGSYSNTLPSGEEEVATRGLGMPIKFWGFDGRLSSGSVDTTSYALDVRSRETSAQRTLALRNAAGALIFHADHGKVWAPSSSGDTTADQVLVNGSNAGGVLSGTYPNPGFFAATEYFRLYPKMIMAWYGSNATTLIGGNSELTDAPGWVLCNGALVTLRSGGSFMVPNMQDRTGIGAGGSVSFGSVMPSTMTTYNMLASINTTHTHVQAAHSHSHNHGAHHHTVASHTHTIAHTHTLSSHTHAITSHTHGLNGHTHGMSHVHNVLNSHTHGLGSHVHTTGSHTHTLNGHFHALASHTHAQTHVHGAGGSPSGLFLIQDSFTTRTGNVTGSTISSGVTPTPTSGHVHVGPDANVFIGGNTGSVDALHPNTGTASPNISGSPIDVSGFANDITGLQSASNTGPAAGTTDQAPSGLTAASESGGLFKTDTDASTGNTAGISSATDTGVPNFPNTSTSGSDTSDTGGSGTLTSDDTTPTTDSTSATPTINNNTAITSIDARPPVVGWWWIFKL